MTAAEKPNAESKAPAVETGEKPAAEGKVLAMETKRKPATGEDPTTEIEKEPATEGKMPATKIPGSAAESGSGKTDGSGEAINERFVRFLRRHHVLTLATVAEGLPYCSNAFYCYDKERNLIVFTSDPATRHAQEMERNPRVAASVVLETKIVGRVQGLQLCGTATRADERAKRMYLKRFPYAALAELTLWAIEPDFMKLTDNTLGFGKKLIWNDKQESSS